MKTQKQMLPKKYINNFCDVLKKINFDDVSKLKKQLAEVLRKKKYLYLWEWWFCSNIKPFSL